MSAVTLIDLAAPIAGSSSPRSFARFDVISLPDPANDDSSSTRDYILVSRDRRRTPSPMRTHAGGNDDRGGRESAPPRRPQSTTTTTTTTNNIDIHEVQTVRPNDACRYASYLVGSRVVSDPMLHVSTRVDPLFFVLAHFHRRGDDGGMAKTNIGETGMGSESAVPSSSSSSSRWMPWDQALANVPDVVMRALDADVISRSRSIVDVMGAGQLGHLLEVSNMCGDDLILCRFVEERALNWLVAKFDRAAGAMRRRAMERKRAAAAARGGDILDDVRGGSGAFVTSFVAIEEEVEEGGPRDVVGGGAGSGSVDGGDLTEPVLGEEDELSVKVGALQLICEYIPTEWRSKLSREVGMTDADWMGKRGTKSSALSTDNEQDAVDRKRPRSTWEGSIGQEDADALLLYTRGNCAKSASVITPGEKRDVQNAQSVGLKKLAKVDTKGMRSLSSFFGAGAKKTKK